MLTGADLVGWVAIAEPAGSGTGLVQLKIETLVMLRHLCSPNPLEIGIAQCLEWQYFPRPALEAAVFVPTQ
ncbi:MAG: hypothetical protein JO227_25135 [Acetobacteraceae bacterium]|nr:hypothetical protein [Acetobacteraceae bacterium]